MSLIIVWSPGVFGDLIRRIKHWFRRITRPAIFEFIERGDDGAVLKRATRTRLITARDEWGRPPLTASIQHRRSDLASKLIEMGGHFPKDGAYVAAAMCNDLKVTQKLIAAGADPDEPSEDWELGRWTPLMWATNRRYYDLMKVLLAAGANIDATGDDGRTAIMCTCAGSNDDLVAFEILCSHNAALTLKDLRGRCILDEARDRANLRQDTAMRDMLLKYYPELKLN